MSPVQSIVVAILSLVLVSCATTAADPDPAQPDHADGTITLSVTLNGSRSREAGAMETANLQASANYAFDLSSAEVDEQSGQRTVNWDQQIPTGSAVWSDERLRTFDCNSVAVTDRTLTSRTVNFGTSADVIGGAMLTVESNGTYRLVINAVPLRSLGTEVVERWENCGGATYDRQEHAWGVPFLEFFIPPNVTLGAFTGSTSPSATEVVGSYSGTQDYTVFSDGVENVTIPITYTVSWNLKLDR